MARLANGSGTIEWPTVGLIVALYAGFGLLTWNAGDIGWYLLLPAGAYLVCLHGSLQHEILHDHPTPWGSVNEMLIFPALSLWLPYRRYRALHQLHHKTPFITDPLEDPESYYLTQSSWHTTPKLRRVLLTFHNTVLGRLLIGPALASLSFWRQELHEFSTGNFAIIKDWLLHIPAVALVLYWVIGVCEISFWQYLLFFAYPGTALTLLRSFAEHQAHEDARLKTVILYSGPLMSLVYLNNNLHAVHHAEPDVPWYELPQHHIAAQSTYLAGDDHYIVNGYRQVLRHYLLKPKEAVRHPIVN